ncbi:hypothetical protein COLO4_08401 [Corchorus olitorius]|uniref:Uncharacterized protein n=1 Tax=Corchorus olitorius TaxID=93759 RepID=A0A1R3KFW8_9ROSI|nr:hypothetical protein COLO4_08401 [Corchorus olitorius]
MMTWQHMCLTWQSDLAILLGCQVKFIPFSLTFPCSICPLLCIGTLFSFHSSRISCDLSLGGSGFKSSLVKLLTEADFLGILTLVIPTEQINGFIPST